MVHPGDIVKVLGSSKEFVVDEVHQHEDLTFDLVVIDNGRFKKLRNLHEKDFTCIGVVE